MPVTWTGTTVGEGDDFTSYCEYGSGRNDYAFLFTAPSDGQYAFVSTADFYHTLSFEEGCGGYEFACDIGGTEQVIDLVAGQQLLVEIDRRWRTLELARDDLLIKRLPEPALLCADHELNASTFTARCVASTGATPYAVASTRWAFEPTTPPRRPSSAPTPVSCALMNRHAADAKFG